jgi:hypothetical protein
MKMNPDQVDGKLLERIPGVIGVLYKKLYGINKI